MDKEFQFYLKLLGLNEHFTEQQLKSAYRQCAEKYHPDKYAGAPALEKQALDIMKQINEAYEYLRHRNGKTPTANAKAHFDQGGKYMDKGMYDEAITEYTQAIKLNPNYAQAYCKRGAAYQRKDWVYFGRNMINSMQLQYDYAMKHGLEYIPISSGAHHERAISDFTQAIEIDPNYAEAYYRRGEEFSNDGNFALSIADCNQAIKLNPDAEAYCMRGMVYNTMGDTVRAIADWNRALQLDPNHQLSFGLLQGTKEVNRLFGKPFK